MYILAPFSWLYAAVMDVRNWMFNRGVLREKEFKVPTVCIGNLAVGGTGKTPHTEWLVEHLLEDGLHVATLSRGYGRKTKGYAEVSADSKAHEVGDEPLQMFHHFKGSVVVAVCEDRQEGIAQLQQRHSELDVIVLDDAFQHRYVRPSVRVLLTDYARPYFVDHVLPWGRLRERRKGSARADAIIVTKCPESLSETTQASIKERLAALPHQRVFFTYMQYADLPIPAADDEIAVVAGIANPRPLIEHLRCKGFQVSEELLFKDHHNFTAADVERIEKAASRAKHIVTTAKDFARLRDLPLSETTKDKIIVQDIKVKVLNDEDNLLYDFIKDTYVDNH